MPEPLESQYIGVLLSQAPKILKISGRISLKDDGAQLIAEGSVMELTLAML